MDRPPAKDSAAVDPSGGCQEAGKEPGSLFREPKCCTDCRTTKTPLWRGGPSGPKSLCNACGIRHRKKRRELLGLQGGEKGKKGRRPSSKSAVLRVLGRGSRDSPLERWILFQLKQGCRWRRLGEVEEAAVLLMALSWDFLCAKP